MADRSNFKDSIRQLAVQLEQDESPAANNSVAATREASSRPTLVKAADEASAEAPTRPSSRRAKRPKALEWLKTRTIYKQVSVELPPELHQMIIRASHKQRMGGRFPGNIRQIYSVAAVEWLERTGWFRLEELGNTEGDDEDEAP
jgi:hypothetical protein